MPKQETIIKFNDQEKTRLDVFLSINLPNLSRSNIQKLIKNGLVTINQLANNKPHTFLKAGDIISVNELVAKEEAVKVIESKNAKVDYNINIIDDRQDFIIIEKPANVLVHPTTTNPNEYTLIDWLIERYPVLKKIGEDPLRPALVHRLDKEVSGLMIIPKTQDMYDWLKKQFKLRLVTKEYTGLVHGTFDKKEGFVDLPITRSKNTGKFAAHSQRQGGKDALTRFEVIQKLINFSLLKINIETGRTNQIRVHFNALGHSLVGDKLYKSKNITKETDLDRVFLHASYLKITLPTGEAIEYTSSLPKDLDNFLSKIK